MHLLHLLQPLQLQAVHGNRLIAGYCCYWEGEPDLVNSKLRLSQL